MENPLSVASAVCGILLFQTMFMRIGPELIVYHRHGTFDRTPMHDPRDRHPTIRHLKERFVGLLPRTRAYSFHTRCPVPTSTPLHTSTSTSDRAHCL